MLGECGFVGPRCGLFVYQILREDRRSKRASRSADHLTIEISGVEAILTEGNLSPWPSEIGEIDRYTNGLPGLPRFALTFDHHIIALEQTSQSRDCMMSTSEFWNAALIEQWSSRMSSKQSTPSNKATQRKRKGNLPGQKLVQEQSPKLDRRDEEQAGAIIASTNAPLAGVAESAELAEPAQLPAENRAADVAALSEEVPAAVPPLGVPARPENSPISMQSIAAVYADYVKRSLQETARFSEKLLSARSFENAIETQNEFARRTYAEFLSASQKIFELYGELAKQTFRVPGSRSVSATERSKR